MVLTVPPEEFLKKSHNLPVFDTRSPGEYRHGHIPGAISLPLFDNDERAEIGTIYKQTGKEEAVLRGLEIVGPKMADLVRAAKKHSVNNTVCLYCWRGGMRSESVAWLLSTAGLKVIRLEKGYKAYRRYIRNAFEGEYKLLVIGGMTGSGKTELLTELSSLGEQIIDLEGLAHHKGSAFGMLGEAPQPTTEHFENLLFELWEKLDKNRIIWVEDESRLIGSVAICDPFFDRMRNAPVIKVEPTKSDRINRLVKDYGNFDTELLRNCILKIKKRLGPQKTEKCLTALDDGKLDVVADVTLDYYDKAYLHGLSKRQNQKVYPLELADEQSVKERAELLISFSRKNIIL